MMTLSDLFDLTYHSLRSNPFRSTLTMLGVFMGVSSVNATILVGNISRAVIAQEMAQRDAPQVTIVPQWDPTNDQPSLLQMEDLGFLHQRLARIRAISASAPIGPVQVLFRDREAKPMMLAISQEAPLTSGRPLIIGRFFTSADFDNYRLVTIIDQFLADQLFRHQNPIGQRLYINDKPYVIVGVVPTRIQTEQPSEGQLLVPMTVYYALTGSRDIGTIQIRPAHLQDLQSIGKQAQELLMQRFPGRKFWVWNNVEDLMQQQEILALASRALTLVGLVSLLVGGVGIANIMIAAVTERTAEIGLRRAIGATQREILAQFLLEAVLLSLGAGMLAVGSVHGVALVITDRFNFPYQFQLQSAALSLGSALLVGGGASILPALRASQIDPVQALRSE